MNRFFMPANLALGLMLLAVGVRAGEPVWQPSLGHTQVPLWPVTVPDAQPAPGPEGIETKQKLVGGRPWMEVSNVALPTLTVYPPQNRNTGVAIVVFPGGGYIGL